MKSNLLTQMMLAVIAISLVAIALRQVRTPEVRAQSPEAYPFYIEPGTRMLRAPDNSRQVLGKVVVDLRNGNIWGFPTLNQEPYPVDAMSTKVPTSQPFLLGKFDFEAANK